MKLLNFFLLFLFYNNLFSQETFPVNGVVENYKPIYAFVNGKIITGTGLDFENGILLIQDDKIIAVDSSLNIPSGAIIHDLNGDYIYPSFIDLYSNYGVPRAKKEDYSYLPQYRNKKKGAFHWNQAIHPEINASENYFNDPKEAEEYMKNGFGTVLSHIQDGILRGTGVLVSLSNKSENQNLLIEAAASFYSFNKGISKQKNPSSLMGSIALIRQTLLDAEWYNNQKKQVNFAYKAITNQQDLPKIFSIHDVLDYSRVYKISDEFEIDFIIKGDGKEMLRIDEVANSDFNLIIPLNFPKAYDVSDPEKAEWITLKNLKEWEAAPFNPFILQKNDVEFCITSSDLNDKKDFLKNLRISVKKGLSKNVALSSLTSIPAKFIGASNFVGSLEPNKLANFIITSGDVFEDGEIHENWTLGQKNIINKKKPIDYRGYYSFISSEYDNEFIEISGTKKNPKFIFTSVDSSTLEIKFYDDKINFYTNDNKFRAIGRFSNDTVLGRYKNQDGEYFDFIMKLDSIYKHETLVKDTNNLNPNAPEIWFPNKSFGFKEKPSQKNILFKNATVWTNEQEGILDSCDVAISNGKIIGVGVNLNAIEYFENLIYDTFDATGLHLTSGIIDEHSHIAISKGVNEGSEAVSSEVRIGDVINPNDHNIYRQLAGGTVVSQLLHGSANPIGGQSAIIKLRWGSNAEEMKIKEAKGYIKFALGENVKQSNWGDFERIRFPQTRMGVEQVFYDAFYRAKEYKNNWKKYNSLSYIEKQKTIPPREDLELDAIVEILDSKRFITCHSYVQSEINMLMHVADSMGFKVNTFTHILEGYKVADKMKKHGAGGSTFSDWWAYKFEVNEAIPYNATLLNNAGVVTAINSDDAEMGRRLNQEAAKAVKYGGTSEEDAWKMITLNPAKLLRLDDRMGSIKIGKDADIVLWSKNPLSVYSKVLQTYVDGKLLFDLDNSDLLFKRDQDERMRIIKLMSTDKTANKRKPFPTFDILYHCDTELDNEHHHEH